MPLLFVSNLELVIVPKGPLSVVLLLSTVILALLGIKPALKEKVLFFYLSGVYAAFMEEILYRGIIFAYHVLAAEAPGRESAEQLADYWVNALQNNLNGELPEGFDAIAIDEIGQEDNTGGSERISAGYIL